MKNPASVEYIKSLFRCPICGKLVGCTESGKVGLLSVRSFTNHVRQCRKANGVKLSKLRHIDDNE